MDQSKLSKIEAVLEQAIDDGIFAGANALVYKDGEEQYYAQAGYADIENGVPIARDTIFRLYSMTKPITAVAAMILMQEGVLNLNEPVSKYLPGFKNQQVAALDGREPVHAEVRIVDLLRMTSGLIYEREEFDVGRQVGAVFSELEARRHTDKAMNTQDVANRLGQCDLMFQPGSHWRYGTSADVMAAVIEIASGQKYSEFLSDTILKPLGMNDTGFYVPKEKQSRLAKTYRETGNGLILDTNPFLGISIGMENPPAFESGGAGLVSTIDDYMRFARMLNDSGKCGSGNGHRGRSNDHKMCNDHRGRNGNDNNICNDSNIYNGGNENNDYHSNDYNDSTIYNGGNKNNDSRGNDYHRSNRSNGYNDHHHKKRNNHDDRGSLDGVRILSQKAVDYLTTPQVDEARAQEMIDSWNGSLDGFSYGNFMRILVNPGKATFMGSKGEYGWDGALGCYFLNSPEDNLSFVLNIQRKDSGTIDTTMRIRNIIFSAI
ncbi:MAG: beta-lactamase family protein [Clostridiales Family XIII bacterium]|jgi:CubicO group peptidase (beta-lactamase class C family)|nr:beta-lactamase family protein [Clostridiales Family XIII bacterium]